MKLWWHHARTLQILAIGITIGAIAGAASAWFMRAPHEVLIIFPFALGFTWFAWMILGLLESQYDDKLERAERKKAEESRRRELAWLAGYTPATTKAAHVWRTPRIGRRPRTNTTDACSRPGSVPLSSPERGEPAASD
jgi:hypothetical protein